MGGISMGDLVRSQFTAIPLPNQDFTGQVIIVTGASHGLGLEAVRHLARLDAGLVILAVRDVGRGHECKTDIEHSYPDSKSAIEVWELDLTSPELVKQFTVRARGLNRLDAVILNAGMATMSFGTVNGMERTVSTNVVGTFELALGLLPTLRQSALQWKTRPRLVLVSSEGHIEANFAERSATDIFGALNDAAKADMTDRYNTTKLLQLLAFYAMRDAADQTLPNPVIFTAVDPGLCDTSLTRELPFIIRVIHRAMRVVLARTAEVGSRTLVHAAADSGPKHHGAYLKDGVISSPGEIVTGPEGPQLRQRVFRQLVRLLASVDTEIACDVLLTDPGEEFSADQE